MVATTTVNKVLVKPANGDDVDTWDQPINGDFDIIDLAFGGSVIINVVAATGTIALTSAQYKPLTMAFTGLLTANLNYQLPSGVGGHWLAYNNTTGAFTVTVSSAGAGSSVVLPQGKSAIIVSDGTNVIFPNAPVAPGGSNTQVQYNNNGLLAGGTGFGFNGTNVTIGTVGTPGALTIVGNQNLAGTTSGFVGFKSPAVGGSTTYTWPAADGSATQLLTTDGAGTLSWSSVSSGVTSVSFGTTGLTPSSPGTGPVVVAGTLVPANGGTGLATYAIGDLIYASGTTTLAKLADVATGNALISGGITTAPAWGKVGLTTHISGVLGLANGGTAVSSAGIAAFNSITGYTASGATGTTSTNIVFSTSPTLTTPTINGGALDAASTVSNSGTQVATSVGFRSSPINPQNGTYSTVIGDNGGTVYHTSGSAHTYTIDNSVSYPDGSLIYFNNESGAGIVTISLSSGTLRWGSSTGNRSLGPNGQAMAQRMTGGTVWRLTGAGIS